MAKIKRIVAMVQILIFNSFSQVIASDLRTSGKNEIADNPFVAYGVNPVTQLVTGYLVALRTAPGRTDECRFVFAGNLTNSQKFSVKYLSEIDGYEKSGPMSPAVVNNVKGDLNMEVKKSQLGGECEWILPFINEPRVKENAGTVAISFGSLSPGNWIGVLAIKSERAPFYRSAEESSVQDAYLVRGDYIYVYAEQPDWYYVKYERRKKTTVGWIRKSDTVQIKMVENGRH
jgi:hypothetical protein